MKTLHIKLENEIHKKLVEIKGNRTWYKFIEDIIEEKWGIKENDY